MALRARELGPFVETQELDSKEETFALVLVVVALDFGDGGGAETGDDALAIDRFQAQTIVGGRLWTTLGASGARHLDRLWPALDLVRELHHLKKNGVIVEAKKRQEIIETLPSPL